MPIYICHHDGLFFEWSTIADAPETYGMTREEFETYYQEEYGQASMDELPRRLARALIQGTSSRHGHTLAELVESNRAGPDDEPLTFDEIIAMIRDGGDQDGDETTA